MCFDRVSALVVCVILIKSVFFPSCMFKIDKRFEQCCTPFTLINFERRHTIIGYKMM